MNIPSSRRIASLILKGIVIIAATVGIYLSVNGGFGTFMRGANSFMFFTIQSNVLIALIAAAGFILLLRKGEIKNGWFILKFVGTVAITLTGSVFCFVLAPTLGDKAWTLNNVLTHVVVPVASIADFFVTGVFGDLKKKHVLFVTIPPIAYVIYAAICYIAGWEFYPGATYPYFFLNWGSPAGAFGFSDKLPFMGCVWWILLLAIPVFGFGFGYLAIIDRMKRKRA